MDGPHAGAPPARLMEAGEPVYVLIGRLLGGEGATAQLQLSPGRIHEFDSDFAPMFRFFQTARTRRQATDWLRWAGAPEGALGDLVDSGLLVEVDTSNPLTAAASLEGVRIIPQSFRDETAPDVPSLCGVRKSERSPVDAFIPTELARLMWDIEEPADIPTGIDDIAMQSDKPLELIARRVLTNLPVMLTLGLARLEWVNASAA